MKLQIIKKLCLLILHKFEVKIGRVGRYDSVAIYQDLSIKCFYNHKLKEDIFPMVEIYNQIHLCIITYEHVWMFVYWQGYEPETVIGKHVGPIHCIVLPSSNTDINMESSSRIHNTNTQNSHNIDSENQSEFTLEEIELINKWNILPFMYVVF